ncbi:acetylxylan esterase [Ferroacidibacillus organovorans]|nr:acetylxylan esterase [Ferroacidibacillus organovorans]
MAQPYDLPLEELEMYQPKLTREVDFDAFWASTLGLIKDANLQVSMREMDYPVDGVRVYELSYCGYMGATIRGFYAVPDRVGPHPGLVVFHGYNWSFDGGIHTVVNWALHGYATFGMLTRGQHSSQDNSISSHGHQLGWMTKGILDPQEYHYRGVYMDAVLALEVLAQQPNIDARRIGVTGGSQGGGLSLAAAALSERAAVVVADYPYLCHFRRAMDVSPTGPYLEINEFFRRNTAPQTEETAMKTLSYFDVMNLAPRITCPVLISVGLIDEITPPSTIFAAYNHLTCAKQIRVYRYFGHEEMPGFQTEKLAYLKAYLK